jgi:ubiquinone/menaquinone biosynthesis C-methylase UbiE
LNQDKSALPEGVYDVEYHTGRQKKLQLIYRLRRRTDEVERAFRTYMQGALRTVVDLGTADGLMLKELRGRLSPEVRYLGIDWSRDLLRAQEISDVWKLQGDALHVPVRDGAADGVIATAIIEHVEDPERMMREAARILRPGGLLVVTTPAPFMERVASALGILKEAGHHCTLDLHVLRQMADRSGFAVKEASKFMFSPIGFPAEKTIERILGPLGLRLLMANQLLVGMRG